MKIAGFLLLPAGWFIVLAALVLLKPTPARNVFILAGTAVEMLGFVLFARAHVPLRGDRG